MCACRRPLSTFKPSCVQPHQPAIPDVGGVARQVCNFLRQRTRTHVQLYSDACHRPKVHEPTTNACGKTLNKPRKETAEWSEAANVFVMAIDQSAWPVLQVDVEARSPGFGPKSPSRYEHEGQLLKRSRS